MWHPAGAVLPIIEGIFARLEQLKPVMIPSEPLSKAIDYALNQREALMRYLEDGRLKPDNNTLRTPSAHWPSVEIMRTPLLCGVKLKLPWMDVWLFCP